MKIPKIANYRPIVISAIALMIGICVGALCVRSTIAFYVVISAIVVVCVASIFLKKKGFQIISIFLLTGFLLMGLFSIVATPKYVNQDVAHVEGRVALVSKATTESKKYVLDSLVVDGQEYSGKAIISATEDYEIGNVIGYVGNFESIEFDPFNSYSASRYSKGIKYQGTAVLTKFLGDGKTNVFEKIKIKLRRVYVDNLGEENGGIALGLIVGDTSFVDYETSEEMRASGISHLFSVSGLHVGFACGIIFFLFRLFNLDKRKSLLIVVAGLMCYGALTGFPVGVVRASIMSVIALITELISEREDPLNTLALTVIIILLISPLELFSVSFLLSCSAIFGIVCFYRSLKNLLKIKNKFVNKLWYSGALSLSANAYIIPVSAYFFGTITPYFIIANLVAVPIASFVYSLLVPFSLLALIWEPLGILMVPFGIPISGIRIIANFIASLPFASIDFGIPLLSGVLYAMGMLILSKYYMGSKRSKIILSSTLFVACALIIFIF